MAGLPLLMLLTGAQRIEQVMFAVDAVLIISSNGQFGLRFGDRAERERMLATRATDASCAPVYVNQVGGQDELVFDGASLVFDSSGALLKDVAQVSPGETITVRVARGTLAADVKDVQRE